MTQHRIPNDHTFAIAHLVFDPTGEYLVSAGSDGSLLIKNVHFLNTVFTRQFSCLITAVAWLSDKDLGGVVCGFDNGSITICTFPIDRKHDQMVPAWTTVPAHKDPLIHISVFKDQMFITATHSEVCLWTQSDDIWVAGPSFHLSTHANGAFLHKVHLVARPAGPGAAITVLCIFANGYVLYVFTSSSIL